MKEDRAAASAEAAGVEGESPLLRRAFLIEGHERAAERPVILHGAKRADPLSPVTASCGLGGRNDAEDPPDEPFAWRHRPALRYVAERREEGAGEACLVRHDSAGSAGTPERPQDIPYKEDGYEGDEYKADQECHGRSPAAR